MEDDLHHQRALKTQDPLMTMREVHRSIAWLLFLGVVLLAAGPVVAESPRAKAPSAAVTEEDNKELEDALRAAPKVADDSQGASEFDRDRFSEAVAQIDLPALAVAGCLMAVPIGAMLIISLAICVERWVRLRRSKVLPEPVAAELAAWSDAGSGVDLQQASRVCQEFPSAASNVLLATLSHNGQTKIEQAIAEACDAERQKMYGRIGWLNLTVTAAPVLGLLGVAWGTINTSFRVSGLPQWEGTISRLVGGCCVGLIATLGGLAVAVPAAIMARYFERRIQAFLNDISMRLRSCWRGKAWAIHSSGEGSAVGRASEAAIQGGGTSVARQPLPALGNQQNTTAAHRA